MGSQSVTFHPTRVNAPRLIPAVQAGTRFAYPWGMEGWIELVDLIAPRPLFEPATFRSRVRRRTAAPPRQPIIQFYTKYTVRKYFQAYFEFALPNDIMGWTHEEVRGEVCYTWENVRTLRTLYEFLSVHYLYRPGYTWYCAFCVLIFLSLFFSFFLYQLMNKIQTNVCSFKLTYRNSLYFV